MTVALPGDGYDASDHRSLAKVDLENGSFDVEVIECDAAVYGPIRVAVYSARCVSMLPLGAHVTLALPSVVDPRLLLVRQVLD